jgi:carboxymethylenebutenolidase
MAEESKIEGRRIKVPAGNREVEVYLASAGVAPAVIIVHEWWGLNPHIEDIARRYARAGFTAAAPDLYGGVTTKDPGEASRLMAGLDQSQAIEDLKAVVAHLRGMEGVSAVGVTGFCMGGSFALLLPCHTKLEAAVPFYGDVPVDASIIAQLSCPVLFIGGAKDEWITVEKMKRLEEALARYGKEGEVKIYADAPHAFFNDTRAEAYRAEDAADAWGRALDFFSRHLKKGQTAQA